MAERRYRLSNAADFDLERLYDWGIDHFGLKAADEYYDGLLQRLEQIAQAPLAWQAVDHIRAGYRRSVYGAHSIYYRIEEDGILIARVIGRENPMTSLSEETSD
jgi:toxin ParE1/3/4